MPIKYLQKSNCQTTDDRNALTATLNEKRFRENFPQAWVWEKPADR